MERPAMLLEAVLHQCSIDLDLSVERDVKQIRHRYEHEGFSFLALTLPKLSDALLKGIESGHFSCPTDFCSHGRLPRLLGGFFKCVFDSDGVLLQDANPDCIEAIRSICDFWKKPEVPCSQARQEAAEMKFIAIEEELSKLTPTIMRKDTYLDQVAGILWTQVFPEVDPLDLVCKHGPGNTADRRLPNGRHEFSWWYQRAEPWFPSALHCYPNYGYAAEAAGFHSLGGTKSLRYLDDWSEPAVRVTFVPKTFKAPRVIALEPSPMQYIQQSLLGYIAPRIEAHWLTKNSIRFSDQSVNQELARKASLDRSLTTLDLSDASDRVHVDLVNRIFKRSGISEYLLVARSGQADLPSGKRLTLYKFASMGSAICFPVEAMVFYTLIQAAMHEQDGRRPSSRSIFNYSKTIAVYGDDIIVPVEYTDAVVHNLEAYGLKVNVSKSFRNSLFRESCGADFYNGVPVRPVYAREMAPDDARVWTASQVMSWEATANLFYAKNKWHVAQVIREMLEGVLRIPIPRSRSSNGDGLCFMSLIFDTNLRFNQDLYAYEQRRVVYIPLKRKDHIDGNAIACLNKWGSSLGQMPQARSELRRLAWDFRCRGHRNGEPRDQTSFGNLGGSIRDVSGSLVRLEQDSENIPALPPRQLEDVYPRDESDPARLVDGRGMGESEQGQLVSASLHTPTRSSERQWPGMNARLAGIDFQSSVKRDAFKSKRRWITMLS